MGTLKVVDSLHASGVGTILIADIEEGTLKKGAEIELSSGEKTKAKSIEENHERLEKAEAGKSVGIAVDASHTEFEKSEKLSFSE